MVVLKIVDKEDLRGLYKSPLSVDRQTAQSRWLIGADQTITQVAHRIREDEWDSDVVFHQTNSDDDAEYAPKQGQSEFMYLRVIFMNTILCLFVSVPAIIYEFISSAGS